MKANESDNPCEFKDYEIIWNGCTEKKGYAGCCVLTKIKPLNVIKGIGCEDKQGRAIAIEYEKFYLVNTYVPNSGEKLKFKDRRLKWDHRMVEFLKGLQEKKPVIWTGDLNVAVEDYDVYDGETNAKRVMTAGFTTYERDNFRNLLKTLDMKDSYRQLYPNARSEAYTFFTMRGKKNLKNENLGWRLDYFVMSSSLMPNVKDVVIRREVNISDHVPLILTVEGLI